MYFWESTTTNRRQNGTIVFFYRFLTTFSQLIEFQYIFWKQLPCFYGNFHMDNMS
jgi:hypothetical protein